MRAPQLPSSFIRAADSWSTQLTSTCDVVMPNSAARRSWMSPIVTEPWIAGVTGLMVRRSKTSVGGISWSLVRSASGVGETARPEGASRKAKSEGPACSCERLA